MSFPNLEVLSHCIRRISNVYKKNENWKCVAQENQHVLHSWWSHFWTKHFRQITENSFWNLSEENLNADTESSEQGNL